MKKFIALFASLTVLALMLALPVVSTGCKTTTVGTNVVTTLDPVKVQQVQDAVEPVFSSVLRRAIANSPQHAAEIGNYARAVGGVFCKMEANNNFTPTYLIEAANQATAGLQNNAPQEIIDAKNAVIAIYKIAYGDQLTWQLPDKVWPKAVASTICNVVNQALIDSGQAGCK
jgi:hypothetical protein